MASHVQARRTRHTRTSFNGRVHALTLGPRTHNCLYKIRSSGVGLSQAIKTSVGKERLKIANADGRIFEE
jgi:hypothetical protein